MIETVINEILEEVKKEQQISPYIDEAYLKNYIKEGEMWLKEIVSVDIDYLVDLKARSLLKMYVLYANHKRLAEFKELYQNEYIELQAKYYTITELP